MKAVIMSVVVPGDEFCVRMNGPTEICNYLDFEGETARCVLGFTPLEDDEVIMKDEKCSQLLPLDWAYNRKNDKEKV